jgi:hypothetical protein
MNCCQCSSQRAFGDNALLIDEGGMTAFKHASSDSLPAGWRNYNNHVLKVHEQHMPISSHTDDNRMVRILLH